MCIFERAPDERRLRSREPAPKPGLAQAPPRRDIWRIGGFAGKLRIYRRLGNR
jgi:hypothetical protein